ncbi:MAG: response regulator transcription factor [Negativicutes bacterium]|nr:response regulator transcription factor [Negativicutes bacterium]
MNNADNPVRILIVDDDEKCLATMRRVLRGHFEIVTTRDPVQALKMFELQGPFAVVISDFQMPFMNGIQLFSRILTIDKCTQRIMLTGHADLQMAIDAVNHGKITAFLTKPTPAISIRAVVADAVRTYQESREELAQKTGPEPTKNPSAAQLQAELYAPLTAKEREILALLSKGFSNEEISLALDITVGTVKSHLNNLFGKMDVNSRSKVVARGIELGLIKTS